MASSNYPRPRTRPRRANFFFTKAVVILTLLAGCKGCPDEATRIAERDRALMAGYDWTYVDSLEGQTCDCEDPCSIWSDARDPWGRDCELTQRLTELNRQHVAILMDCATSTYPRTEEADHDMCLRERLTEGILRAELMKLAVEYMPRYDLNPALLVEERLEEAAVRTENDCSAQNSTY